LSGQVDPSSETLIHRADATLAVGAELTVDQEVALDALDEWMELGSLPMHFEVRPWMRELLGPGRTLHFHATDTAPELRMTGAAIGRTMPGTFQAHAIACATLAGDGCARQ